MIHRKALDYLKEWKTRSTRKPLVVRGARQVGKTSLVVDLFGAAEFESVAKIDFEAMEDAADYFRSKDPEKIIPLLEVATGQRIIDGKTLLFLDEIQAAPQVLATLRFFHEKRPTLHVIAAGSLLEFALEEFEYSMPVGRIEYLFLEPLSFEEFLPAVGARGLAEWLAGYVPGDEVPDAIHRECMEKVLLYWVVGGLPEAVKVFAATNSFLEVERVQQTLVETYIDDFAKYRRRVPQAMLEAVFRSAPLQIGKKFSYVAVSRDVRSRELGAAVALLGKAMVLTRVNRSRADGIPVGAGEDSRNFKAYALDIGLCARQLGLSITSVKLPLDSRAMAERGGFCEQFVAENLKCAMSEYAEHTLHHWAREKDGSDAEVDFVVQVGSSIVPVEVKAGATGTMKSLHQFLMEKKRDFGVRINGDKPSYLETIFTDIKGTEHPFRLLSLPFYMCGQFNRLAQLALDKQIPPFKP
jgi:hypothetical protein